jgi:hypothetical protein
MKAVAGPQDLAYLNLKSISGPSIKAHPMSNKHAQEQAKAAKV